MYLILKNINLKLQDKFPKYLSCNLIYQLSQNIIGIVLPIIIIIIWYLLTITETVRNNLLPPPQEVIDELLNLSSDGTLFSHILITLSRVFYGFVFGAVVATILGVITGVSPTLRS